MFGASIDEELQILLTLDADGYVKTAKLVGTATKSLDRDLDALTNRNKKVKSSFSDMDSQLGKLQGMFNAAMGVTKAFVGTLAALDAAIIGGGVAASQKAAEYEALELSIQALEGSADKAKETLSELRQIAKGPGLGVQSAIELYGGLRRGGIDQRTSMELTRQTGNAVAYTGGGKEELGRIALAMEQIAESPTLRGQDVMQLAQARLPVYQALKNQFGSADTAELAKMGISSKQAIAALLVEFSKLPRVAGGAKNTFENLSDAIEFAQVNIGKGINDGIMPAVNEFTDAIGKLNEDGSLKMFGSDLADIFLDVLNSVTGGASNAQAALDGAMETVLTIAIASRNFVENLQAGWDLVKKFTPAGILSDKVGKGLGESPADEAARMMGDIRDHRKMLDVGDKKGLTWKDGHWEKKQTGSGSPSSPAPDAPISPDHKFLDEQLAHLREISANTRSLRRLEDALIGGGHAFANAANPRNLGRLHAGGGTALGHKIGTIIEDYIANAFTGHARTGTLSPRGF